MNIRNYNIYFNTHTISGIIICALLYVIFFAGSFSFFRDEISAWQKNRSAYAHPASANDYDYLLDSLHAAHNLLGRDITFYVQDNNVQAYVNMGPSQDTTVKKKSTGEDGPRRGRRGRGNGDSAYFQYDFKQNKAGSYAESYDMGEFLYRLHFLAQLNQVPIRIGTPFGYLVAGIVSFLFLFALITGLLLHWDKIVSNFFTFRPWSKWKTIWTDMHTALGVIGFPFQLMYAVTGVILIVNTALVLPFSKLLYDGNSEELYTAIGYNDASTYEYAYQPLGERVALNPYLQQVSERWPGSHASRIYIKNYGDQSMHITVEATPSVETNFAGAGKITFHPASHSITTEKSPTVSVTYLDRVKALIYRLHFGDFGGYPVKTTFFVLGIMGCLVIISGILIWLVARDKKNIPAHKRKFNFWAANVFVAICLTMLPVTALTFIAIKLNPAADQTFIYRIYFYSWLASSCLYVARRNLRTTNKETLALGALLSLCIPLVNGIKTGHWMWQTYRTGALDIFVVDLLWLVIGIVGVIAVLRIRANERKVGPEKPVIPATREVAPITPLEEPRSAIDHP
ncbi:PepSY-associated TM helix domain-containing protein [Parapedobacter sp. 2B3]|uniref:PepSY-associated TM helix domain-containing protein n=1 Tax=Parapedobacter sp. 2B3 TaxID=3342381 RepID=UPI0035B5765F